MVERIIDWSARNKFLVLLLCAAAFAGEGEEGAGHSGGALAVQEGGGEKGGGGDERHADKRAFLREHSNKESREDAERHAPRRKS